MRLKFLGPFSERLAQTFTKLQLGLALCCVAIGETVLAEVIDGCQEFLKLVDAARQLFDERGFRSLPLMVPCACSCHGSVKKV